jgi:hypothetical protein
METIPTLPQTGINFSFIPCNIGKIWSVKLLMSHVRSTFSKGCHTSNLSCFGIPSTNPKR